MIYFIEKTLCLRLGRSSTIPDCDITAPWPGELQEPRSHALDYFHYQVKVASLAGRIYEQLYSGNALQLPEDSRMDRARNLGEQLDRYAADSRKANVILSPLTHYRLVFVSSHAHRLIYHSNFGNVQPRMAT